MGLSSIINLSPHHPQKKKQKKNKKKNSDFGCCPF